MYFIPGGQVPTVFRWITGVHLLFLRNEGHSAELMAAKRNRWTNAAGICNGFQALIARTSSVWRNGVQEENCSQR